MAPGCAVLGGLQSVHGLRCYGNITRITPNVSEYMLVLAMSSFLCGSFFENIRCLVINVHFHVLQETLMKYRLTPFGQNGHWPKIGGWVPI